MPLRRPLPANPEEDGEEQVHLPIDPMSPISSEHIPVGDDWGYQLKWDGVRIVAELENGRVTLYSRKGLVKNAIYPELTAFLSQIGGRMVLDGEAVVFDPGKGRPNFQLVLQRERMRLPGRISENAGRLPVTLVLFDLLEWEGEDMRQLPYAVRHNRLMERFPDRKERLFVTDLFNDGELLWQWVKKNEWEGIVSKRLSSPYRTGKQHKDWYKKKTVRRFEVQIVGLTLNEGHLASLIMVQDGVYFGRVSLGLNEAEKRRLLQLPQRPESPLATLPSDLKGIRLLWLENPFPAVVSGLEITDYGMLRHPKIVSLTY